MFDENIAPRVSRALAALFPDDDVIHKRDRFGPRTADVEWIAALGRERGWCVVSGDRRITRNKAEQVAWRSTDLIGFFFERSLNNADPPTQAARLIRYWPVLIGHSSTTRGPAMSGLSLNKSPKLNQIGFS